MSAVLGRRSSRKGRADDIERGKMVKLERAERDLAELKERAHRATTYLTARRERNHFAESIRLTMRETP